VPETCWASNNICNKNHLLHLVGILFPHINDDARSKSLQISCNYSQGRAAQDHSNAHFLTGYWEVRFGRMYTSCPVWQTTFLKTWREVHNYFSSNSADRTQAFHIWQTSHLVSDVYKKKNWTGCTVPIEIQIYLKTVTTKCMQNTPMNKSKQ
jgi:hypothetical protein